MACFFFQNLVDLNLIDLEKKIAKIFVVFLKIHPLEKITDPALVLPNSNSRLLFQRSKQNNGVFLIGWLQT